MRLIATMPVRNEAWCLGLTLRASLLWCDEVIVLMHECNDASGDIIEAVIREEDRGRVTVLRASGDWTEMQHRESMLLKAREHKATHIAIVDADEVLSGNINRDDARAFCDVSAQQIVQYPLYNLRGSLDRYHASGIWSGKSTCLAFRDDPHLSWALCGDRFHHRHPHGMTLTPVLPLRRPGGILHLWGASERRLRAKHALYKITERLRWPAKPVRHIEEKYNWAIYGDFKNSNYGTPATWTYAPIPVEWWQPYAKWLRHVDIESVPWQEAEVRQLVRLHPGVEAGFDLFGIT